MRSVMMAAVAILAMSARVDAWPIVIADGTMEVEAGGWPGTLAFEADGLTYSGNGANTFTGSGVLALGTIYQIGAVGSLATMIAIPDLFGVAYAYGERYDIGRNGPAGMWIRTSGSFVFDGSDVVVPFALAGGFVPNDGHERIDLTGSGVVALTFGAIVGGGWRFERAAYHMGVSSVAQEARSAVPAVPVGEPVSLPAVAVLAGAWAVRRQRGVVR